MRAVAVPRAIAVVVAVVLAGAIGCRGDGAPRSGGAAKRIAIPPPPRDYEAIARALYAGEPGYEKRWPVEFRVRVIEGLVQDLQRALADLAVPAAPFFADRVEWFWPEPAVSSDGNDGWRERPGGVRERDTRAQSAPDLVDRARLEAAWSAVLAPYAWLERVTLKPKGAALDGDDGLRATVAIELAGRAADGGWRRDAGAAEVLFRRGPAGWRIARWHTTAMRTQRAAEKLFDDVTDAWLADVSPSVRARLQTRSVSDERHRAMLDGKLEGATVAHLQPLAMDAHPGVVALDVNGDHWDDLFVWDVEGAAMLLVNDGGRGFREAAAEYGLDVSDVSAAAFADLDGDGALDAVIGRWAAPSEIRWGRAGRFWPGAAGRYGRLPSQVASVSVADVDGDGRLDLFFATAAHDFHPKLVGLLEGGDAAIADLPPDEQAALRAALPAARAASAAGRFDVNVDQMGPANALLLNGGGGRFDDVTAAAGLAIYRNTLQGAFGDADGDGRPDLFLANDFAPAAFFVNRSTPGRPRFEDGTRAADADRIYFGMGASWGDVDGDGDLDLYVSAMQSSAGARIMADERNFAAEHGDEARRARKEAARGSTLLRNEGGGRFVDATAEAAYAPARAAQWAYGGQMIDIDGDGWRDLFAPNGFFTSSLSPDDPFVRDL
jgi:hypothetical protein